MTVDLLKPKEVAEMLGISLVTLRRWVNKRGILKPLRINERGDRRWNREDVEIFVKELRG